MPEGLGSPDLECVMLDIPPFPVRTYGGPSSDLFYGDTPELKYAQGAVAETKAHVTLLFGIHPSSDYRRNVDSVLKGWEIPVVTIDHVGYFPSRIEGQDYNCVVAHVVPSPLLREANARLQVLDHTNEYPEYKPHITLVYIKGSANLDRWVRDLNTQYKGKQFIPAGINYGDD